MRTFNFEQDHIDPIWKEGRDYQLVCGFDQWVTIHQCKLGIDPTPKNRIRIN